MEPPGNENMHLFSSDIPPKQVPALAALGPRTWNFPGLSPEQPTRSQNCRVDPIEGHVLPTTTTSVSNEMSDLLKLTQRSIHNETNNLPHQNLTSYLNNRLDVFSEYSFTRPQSRHYRSQSVQPQTQRAEDIQISERCFDHRKLTVTSGSGMMPESISFAQRFGDFSNRHNPDELSKFCNARKELDPTVYTTAGRVVSNTSRHKPNLSKIIHMHTIGKSARFNRASTAEPVSSNRNLQTWAWLDKLPQAGVPEKVFFEDSPSVQPESDEIFSNRLEVNSTKSEFHSAQSSFSQPRRGATASPRDELTFVHLNQSREVETVPRQTIPSKRSSSDHKILSDQVKRRKGDNEKQESDSRTFVAGSDGHIGPRSQHINTRHRPVQMDPDIQRGRESTPMDWSAPTPLKITSYMKNGKVQQEVPDVISLLSSDDSVADIPPNKLSIPTERLSIPVTAVSTSKNVLPIRSSRISESNGKLPTVTPEGKPNNEAEEEQRQKRAALTTLTKEDNAPVTEIFGEGTLDGEEKRDNLEIQRTASLEAKRAKENKDEEQKKAKLKVETQKQLEAEEKSKLSTLMKEQEEARKKAIRDLKRSEDALVEERKLDERRGATAERIQERRLKDQEIQTKRISEGGFRSTQTEKDELQALKINQEIAKKQAASLHSAKLDGNAVQADEDSLFLPEDIPKRNQGKLLLNEVMSAVKLKGPKNAAEVFAQTTTNSGISGYRTERDTVERKVSIGKALYSRRRPEIQQKVLDQSSAGKDIARPERPINTQESNNPNTTDNRLGYKTSKSSGFIIDDFEDATDASSAPSCHSSGFKTSLATDVHAQSLTNSSWSEPASKVLQTKLKANHVASSLNSTNISSESIQSGLATSVSQKSASSVKLLSGVGQRENEKGLACARKPKKDKRTEQQKLARKRKDDERARQKQKERLIKAANQAGADISETMLEIQLDAFMQKRENELQRRKEIRDRKEANQIEPDPAAAEALPEVAFVATSPPTPEVETDKDDHENNSMEAWQLNAETNARKESEVETLKHLDALRKTRGVQFLEAARKTHVVDINSDSDVSEEDPDEPIVARNKNLSPAVVADENYANDVENSSDHEKDHHVFTDSCATSRSANTSFGSTPNSKTSVGFFSKEQTYVYTVHQVQIIEREDQESEVVERFLSLEEANSCAQTHTHAVRQRYQQLLPSMTSTFEDRMYSSQVWYDETKENGLFVRVARQRQALKDLANLDPVNIPKRLPEKSWLLKQTTTRIDEAIDDQPAKEIYETIIVPKLHFSNLIDANYAACESALKFLKPKRAKIDHIAQYNNDLSKQLRETRDQDIENNKSFHAEIEVSDENVCWMKPLRKIIFQVEEFEMMGPMN